MAIKTLYFAYLPGCVACKAAEPELKKFEKDSLMMVLRVNVAAADPHPLIEQAKVRAAPTYLLTEKGAVIKMKAGAMTAKQLSKWVADD